MINGQIVVFKLKEHEFGIDINKVLEVLNYEPVRPVPEVPSYVEGIINVRGVIYPVYNLCKRLNMDTSEINSETKIILLHLEKSKLGFLVDGVSEILTVQAEEVESAPEMIDRKGVSCIEGIVKKDDRMILVLNVDALISDAENLFVQGVSNEDDYCCNAE